MEGGSSLACAECGYTTKDMEDFNKHVQQHEDTPNKMDPSCPPKIFPGFCNIPPALLPPPQMPPNITDMMRLLLMSQYPQPQQQQLLMQLQQQRLQTVATSAQSTPIKPELDESTGQAKSPTSSTTPNSPVMRRSPRPAGGKSKKTLHSCPHCNFTTFMSQHMKSHLEAHDRHKGAMYQCDICHMQFSQKANMHRHRNRHTGKKPYDCRYCGKKFFRKDQMQEHSMTHIKTGENFDCPVAGCDEMFKQHSGLRNHLDEGHVITALSQASCKRCASTFAKPRRLLFHYQTKCDDKIASGGKREDPEFSDEEGCSSTPPPAGNGSDAVERNNNTLTASFLLSQLSGRQGMLPTPQRPGIRDLFSGFWSQLNLSSDLSFGSQNSVEIPPVMPKSENPNCESLFNKPSIESLEIQNKDELVKILENFKKSQPMDWAAKEEEEEDHSSTHSPTTDSRASSTSSPCQEHKSAAAVGERAEAEAVKTSCVHCGIEFNDERLHELHRRMHGDDAEPWKCGFCHKVYADKIAFHVHLAERRC